MKLSHVSIVLITCGIILSSCSRFNAYENVEFIEKSPADWENPEVYQINKEKPRASFVPFCSLVRAFLTLDSEKSFSTHRKSMIPSMLVSFHSKR